MTFPCCPIEAPCLDHGGTSHLPDPEPERFRVTAAGMTSYPPGQPGAEAEAEAG
jgi:hypothetical protein